MNIYYYIIILIAFGIIIWLCIRYNHIVKLYQKQIIINEGGRIKAMNGFENEKIIPFSNHYNSFVLFKRLVKYLNDNNIEYFIIGGLLIGLFRHNNSFIPWDDDIDICILEKDLDKLDDSFNKNSFVIKYTGGGEYIDDDYNFIDIFVLKDLNYMDKIHRELWPNEYFNSNDELFPLRKKEFRLYLPDGKIFDAIYVNIPNKSEDYLERAFHNYKNVFKSCNTHNSFYSLVYKDFTIGNSRSL